MAPRYIGKTSLAGLTAPQADGTPALAAYTRLQDLLRDRVGAAAANLFAEPVITWGNAEAPGSVSWYTELPGEPEPLGTLPPDRRASVETRLREIIARLHPLLDDPQAGPLLRSALAIRGTGSILALGGVPLLIDWGLAEPGPGSGADQAARASAWAAPYLPAAATAVTTAPHQTAAPPPQFSPASRPPAGPPRARSAWDWALIPAAIVLAALFLGGGLWIGARMVAARVAFRPSTVNLLDEAAAQRALAQQKEANAALEKEIEARRALLAGNVCSPDPAQRPSLGPDRQAAVPPGAVAPAPGQPFQGTLGQLLTQAVVLIIAPGAEGTSSGTGFFIAPDTIVTNRHVIEGADPQKLLVTSKKLGRLTRVSVVAQTPDSEIGNADVAVLHVEGETGVQPLAFSTVAAPLDAVIAAGFPGLLLQSDEAFARLKDGDASAVPEVILTDGKINAIQSAPGGLKIMPHSAAVSGGNSGGPLVDACGRVLGINTFITANREQVVHANYAQKTEGVLAFLKEKGVAASDVTTACTPGAPPAVPAAPAAPAAPATPAAPAPITPATPTPASPG